MPLEFEPLVTPSEVGRALKVDPRTASRWAKTGRVRSVRTPGGWYRLYRADLEAMLRGETPPRGDGK